MDGELFKLVGGGELFRSGCWDQCEEDGVVADIAISVPSSKHWQGGEGVELVSVAISSRDGLAAEWVAG